MDAAAQLLKPTARSSVQSINAPGQASLAPSASQAVTGIVNSSTAPLEKTNGDNGNRESESEKVPGGNDMAGRNKRESGSTVGSESTLAGASAGVVAEDRMAALRLQSDR